MAETQVKNTFIDVNLPSTATPVPSPPASAPARQAVALKERDESQAAEDASAATTGTAAGTAPAGIARRAKPNPLNFLSQNSMAACGHCPKGQAQSIELPLAEFHGVRLPELNEETMDLNGEQFKSITVLQAVPSLRGRYQAVELEWSASACCTHQCCGSICKTLATSRSRILGLQSSWVSVA
eukprot:g24051.t1